MEYPVRMKSPVHKYHYSNRSYVEINSNKEGFILVIILQFSPSGNVCKNPPSYRALHGLTAMRSTDIVQVKKEMHMIELNKITKHFGDKKLFTNYSLWVSSREKILISAPSGSGKTTRRLMGFELQDKGQVTIGGKTMNHHNIRDIRSQISYVSQDTDLNDEPLRNQLETIFTYKVNRHIQDWEEKFESLRPVYMLPDNILDEDINKLSGGERQRVALIIALLLDRPIMILDEITSGLDNALKRTIVEDLLNSDKTILIVSHDEVWHGHDNIREVSLK